MLHLCLKFPHSVVKQSEHNETQKSYSAIWEIQFCPLYQSISLSNQFRKHSIILSPQAVQETHWRFEPRTSTNACWHVWRNVDQKGSAAMLTSIHSAGVAPEVNLRNPLSAGEVAHKWGNPALALKPRADITRSPKQGYQWPTKRTYVLQKFILKKIEKIETHCNF